MKQKQTIIVALLLFCGILFSQNISVSADQGSSTSNAESAGTESTDTNEGEVSGGTGTDVDALIKNLNAISDDNTSFNTDDFLQVGKEGAHTLSSGNDETSLLNKILRYVIQLVGTFGVLMMVIAGFFMVTSEGDDNRLQKGKNIFLYTIVGLLVAFTSYAVIQFVLSVLFS